MKGGKIYNNEKRKKNKEERKTKKQKKQLNGICSDKEEMKCKII